MATVITEFAQTIVLRLTASGVWKPVMEDKGLDHVWEGYSKKRSADDTFMADYTDLDAEAAIFYGKALALQFGVTRRIQECEALLAMVELRGTLHSESK